MDEATLKHQAHRQATAYGLTQERLRSVFIAGYIACHRDAVLNKNGASKLSGAKRRGKSLSICREFLEEETFDDALSRVTNLELYRGFRLWWEEVNDVPPMGPRVFLRALKDAGLSPRHTSGGLAFDGIRISDSRYADATGGSHG